MIGILVVTHRDLGKELLNAAEFIIGRIEAADAVAITQTSDSKKLRGQIDRKIASLDDGDGVLILTDMFGGTPSNLSLSFLKENQIEVLTGVNLPMLIAIVQNRSDVDLNHLAEMGREAGRAGISLAGKLLEAQ